MVGIISIDNSVSQAVITLKQKQLLICQTEFTCPNELNNDFT